VTLLLDARQLAAIRRHGEADYPHEACGLIGGHADREEAGKGGGDRKIAVQLVPLSNARLDSRRNRYLIAPEAFRRAEALLARDGLEVLGVYHSHPDHAAVPSGFDREHAWPWLSYVIVGVARGRAQDARSWTLADDRSAFSEEALIVEDRKVVWQSQS
jgi:proteasome lid subunit RPN8/RPN11